MSLRHCLLALLLGLSLPLQAATELIQLNYRSADEVLPLVQAALDGQGKASSYGNQLLINAAPEKIAEIRDLLGQLDKAPRRLLISVDTSVAHLAGALGRPVWTLLCYAPDWRWLQDREDSPWYPTMRLFRQRAPGDWTGLVERVAAELHVLAGR